ncbi:MAG: response regulator, partial [Bacteroidetes bacterium]|nr:response regulator [Bacteroidota bacterium]
MFKAIIVEDEIHNAEGLLYLLEKNCADVKVEAVCASVKEAAKKITELKPDLLFLDIHLGDGTGFQLLEKFPNPEFKVIFITAYDEYA